jgi:hypothetical protein
LKNLDLTSLTLAQEYYAWVLIISVEASLFPGAVNDNIPENFREQQSYPKISILGAA